MVRGRLEMRAWQYVTDRTQSWFISCCFPQVLRNFQKYFFFLLLPLSRKKYFCYIYRYTSVSVNMLRQGQKVTPLMNEVIASQTVTTCFPLTFNRLSCLLIFSRMFSISQSLLCKEFMILCIVELNGREEVTGRPNRAPLHFQVMSPWTAACQQDTAGECWRDK